MAGIDKIYGTRDQYSEFKSWLDDNNEGISKLLYPVEDQRQANQVIIANFSSRVDAWLLRHCPIVWLTDFIKGQYGGHDPYEWFDGCICIAYEQRFNDPEAREVDLKIREEE